MDEEKDITTPEENPGTSPEPKATDSAEAGEDAALNPGGEVGQEAEKKPKKKRKHLIRPFWLRWIVKTILALIVIVILLPVLVYVPPVQDFIVEVVEKEMKKSTGMDVSVGKFRLKFPLDLSIQDISIVEASGDTMVSAREALAEVKLMPLLKLDVDIDKLKLQDAYYRMVSEDTSMIMTLRAGFLEVDDKSSFNIKENDINLNKAVLRDANIQMYNDVWKKKPNPNDTAKNELKIKIGDLSGERIRFGMSMLPSIDTLSVYADNLVFKQGLIDLGASKITATELIADGGEATYLTPTPEYIETHPEPVDTISPVSPPMVIEGKKVIFKNFDVLYGIAGAKPLPGFDSNYIQVKGINMTVDDFYNEASTLKIPIQSLQGTERCGLQITEGKGLVSIDSVGIRLDSLMVRTPFSSLDVNADLPFELLEFKPEAPVNVDISGSLAIKDITDFMPDLKEYTRLLPQNQPINLAVETSGTLTDIDVRKFDVAVPTTLSLHTFGTAQNPLDFKKLKANIDLDGELFNPSIVEHFTGDVGFKIPKLHIKGQAAIEPDLYSGNLSLTTPQGDVAAKGFVNMNSERYDAHLEVKDVNVAYFMPDLGIGDVSATLDAKGAGFNPIEPRASTDINLQLHRIQYNRLTLKDISLIASLRDHDYDIKLNSENPGADIELALKGFIYPDKYSASGYVSCYDLDLNKLGLDKSVNGGSFDIDIDGTASPDKWLYDLDLTVNNLDWTIGEQNIVLPEGIEARLLAEAQSVFFNLDCQEINVKFESSENLKNVIDKFSRVPDVAIKQIEERDLKIEELHDMLPQFDLSFTSPGNGILGEFLDSTGVELDTIDLYLANDSIISGYVDVLGLRTESLNIDTINLNLSQRDALLDYKLHVGNRPGTLDEFANVNLSGYLGGNRLSAYFTQENIQKEQGYRLGFTAAFIDDKMVTVHFTPLKATIGYRPWTLNPDNYVDVNLTNYKIEANLEAQSNESAILLETRASADDLQELHLKLTNIHLQEFLQMSATAPPLTATINSDIRARYDGEEIVGVGRINITDFTYDNVNVDDLNISLQASMDLDGTYDVSASLAVEKHNALTVSSKLVTGEDGLEPEYIKLIVDRFPLSAANPFLGNDVATLKGSISGEMDLTGGFTKPVLNGALSCDSVSVYLPIMASSLRFDNTPLTVRNNVISFNNFGIYGANSNPLTIDGKIDATSFTDIYLDINAHASNFQLINNDRRAGSDIYGKVFLNFNASAKGPLTRFTADANLNILGNTDVTYAIPDANTAIQGERMNDVVKFVNLSDTASYHLETEESVFMRLNASVTITPGAQVNVLLSANGTDRVQLSPSGTVNLYRNFMGDMTLNGQLYTGNGFARYNIPVIGDKEFTFDPASYVLWNGPMMNPVLNIKGTNTMKASVSQNGGNSRLVNFLITLNITGTLSAPNLLFDLGSDDDMTIENQLQAMSADQRNSAAMNLLVTGQYSAGDISTNAGPLTGNVYNFLTQQLNSWAAKNIRGVDLSFGVNQYDMTTDGQTSTTTSYSYQLSKSLFNNRFKISIGGNYSTDDSADDNLTQNLISDISFEYILRQSQYQTMLVKLFRHNGYESILEGEIVEMGAGFVYKRKLGDFKSLFDFRKRKRRQSPAVTSRPDQDPALKPDSDSHDGTGSPEDVNPESSNNEANNTVESTSNH